MFSRVRRLVLVTLAALLAGYALVCLGFFVAQRAILFPAPDELHTVSDGAVRIDVPGATFFRWRTAAGEGPVVVHFHSNGDQVADLSWMGQEWGRAGVSFAAVEYPGYPGAAGTPSEDAMLDAAEAALLHLTRELKVERSRLVLVGQSFGAGIALAMAARGWGARVVLISAYTSWPDVAAHAFPWLPTGLLVRDRFDAASSAAKVNVPTLVVHGTRDTIVPFAQGEAVSAMIPKATFLRVEGGHHHDVLEWGRTQASVLAFIVGP